MKNALICICTLFICVTSYAQRQLWGMTMEGGQNKAGVIFKMDSVANNFGSEYDFFKIEGKNPQSNLIQATDGNLYGMTKTGGANDFGVLFQYNPVTQKYKRIVDFDGGTNGKFPYGSLVQATDGKLYGMTYQGGANNMGVLFQLDPLTSVLIKKLDFDGTVNGCYPTGSLIQASDGKLYGMTSKGGVNDYGVIFQLDPINSVYTKKLDFSWAANGANPYGSLMQANDGKLYGLTYKGGSSSYGVLFQYNPSTSVLVKKIDFTLSANGHSPNGSLIQALDGKLYGMTTNGGTYNLGTIFQYDITTSLYTKRVDFDGSAKGRYPYGDLLQASDGKLYGMTYDGGLNNRGVLFQFDPVSSGYNKLLDLTVTTGCYPYGSIMQANDGKLYGLTSNYGFVYGVLFQYDISQSTYSKKIEFERSPDGSRPSGSLMQATNGKFYGVTLSGGDAENGVVFQYDMITSTYTKKASFDATTGSYVSCTLVEANDGKLYGLSFGGGVGGYGVLFQFDPVTSIITPKVILNNSIGNSPIGSLVKAADGKLYGMTRDGGLNNLGVLFQYDPATSVYTKKIDFAGSSNGQNPVGSLIQATDGMLYGLAAGGLNNYGIIFQYNPNTNVIINKYDFDNTNGSFPVGSLIQAIDGKLYGMTNQGGTNNYGVIFNYNLTNSAVTKLIDFNYNNGKNPESSLMQSADGKMYGMTFKGGDYDMGVLFQYVPSTNSILKKIDFNGSNGSNPLYTGLIETLRSTISSSADATTKCPGNTMNVAYSNAFLCKAGNKFTVQLSNASGSFDAPVNIGTVSATTPGTIAATIPLTTAPGTGYRIRVISNNPIVIGNDNGINITVHAKPRIGFSANSLSQCMNGNSFVFTDTSTIANGSMNRIWNFGGGDTSTSISVTRHYVNAGSYPVTLSAISNNGCKDSIIKSVTIQPSPVAGFTGSDSMKCVNGIFSFTDTSSVSTGTFQRVWSFGNGDTSSLPNPSKSFSLSGVYAVKLFVSANNGCKDSVSKNVTVNPNPKAGFTVNKQSQCLPLNSFVFTDTSLIATGSLNRKWTITSTDTASTPVFNKVFSDTGGYVVKLLTISNDGCSDSASKTVTVNVNPKPGFVVNAETQCVNGNNFTFQDTTERLHGNLITQWNLGELDTSTKINVTKSFVLTGQYSIKLVSTTNQGCKDSISKTVFVNPNPKAGFSSNQQVQCFRGNSFSFTDTSGISSGTFFRKWDLGEGDTFSTVGPLKVFGNHGTYTIKLVTTSENGCKDSALKTVMVHPNPRAGFSVNDASQCLKSNSFSFSDTVLVNGIITRVWNFGDGNTSTDSIAHRVYLVPGNYAVSLVVANGFGCKDSIKNDVLVNPNPKAGYTVDNDNQCLKGNSFLFTDTSGAGNGLTRIWFYGDGDTASAISPRKTFSQHGEYKVTILLTHNNGCTDSVTKTVNVKPMPDVTITKVGVSLTANQNAGQYKWIDCNNGNGIIAGATSQTYTPNVNGSYAVIVTKEDCSDTSNCMVVNTVGVEAEQMVLKQLSIFPNPNSGTFTIQSTVEGLYDIINELGQTVRSIELIPENNYTINIENLVDGMYFIVGLNDDRLFKQKILVRH